MFDIATIIYILLLLILLHAVITIPSAAAASSRSRGNNNNKENDSLYTKYPPGYTVYGMDDGGCFFCAEEDSQTIPLIGEELNEHCRMMCEADVDCVAYTVARPQGKTVPLDEALYFSSLA